MLNRTPHELVLFAEVDRALDPSGFLVSTFDLNEPGGPKSARWWGSVPCLERSDTFRSYECKESRRERHIIRT